MESKPRNVVRTGFSIAQGRRNTSFSTKIRKALGKKPKKDGRKLRTIKSEDGGRKRVSILFLRSSLKNDCAYPFSWNFCAFLPPPRGASGNSLGLWEVNKFSNFSEFQEFAAT